MYLKLTHPTQLRARHIFIPVNPKTEVHSEILTDFTQEDLDRHAAHMTDLGMDVRHFMHWPCVAVKKRVGVLLKKQPAVLELTINEGPTPKVFLTNYNTLLLTDEGKRLDRLFRYDVVAAGDITPGAGENVIG